MNNMGLFDTINYIDDSITIRNPEIINVHEHKAPTDESIKLLAEIHQKTIDNILFKIPVDNNLITGEVFLMEGAYSSAYDYHLIVIKFKINGKEFVVERQIQRSEMFNNKDLENMKKMVKQNAEAIILWYTLKMFAEVAFEQVTGKKLDERLMKQIIR